MCFNKVLSKGSKYLCKCDRSILFIYMGKHVFVCHYGVLCVDELGFTFFFFKSILELGCNVTKCVKRQGSEFQMHSRCKLNTGAKANLCHFSRMSYRGSMVSVPGCMGITLATFAVAERFDTRGEPVGALFVVS